MSNYTSARRISLIVCLQNLLSQHVLQSLIFILRTTLYKKSLFNIGHSSIGGINCSLLSFVILGTLLEVIDCSYAKNATRGAGRVPGVFLRQEGVQEVPPELSNHSHSERAHKSSHRALGTARRLPPVHIGHRVW